MDPSSFLPGPLAGEINAWHIALRWWAQSMW
jgi:hypothetical protein